MSEQARVPNIRSTPQAIADITRGLKTYTKVHQKFTAASGEIFSKDEDSVVRIIQNLGTNAVAWSIRAGNSVIDLNNPNDGYHVLAAGTSINDGLGGAMNLSFTTERIVVQSIDDAAMNLAITQLNSVNKRFD